MMGHDGVQIAPDCRHVAGTVCRWRASCVGGHHQKMTATSNLPRHEMTDSAKVTWKNVRNCMLMLRKEVQHNLVSWPRADPDVVESMLVLNSIDVPWFWNVPVVMMVSCACWLCCCFSETKPGIEVKPFGVLVILLTFWSRTRHPRHWNKERVWTLHWNETRWNVDVKLTFWNEARQWN